MLQLQQINNSVMLQLQQINNSVMLQLFSMIIVSYLLVAIKFCLIYLATNDLAVRCIVTQSATCEQFNLLANFTYRLSLSAKQHEL